ncbi:MAG TPA: hypothetical protein VGJ20_42240 [Xanthobacteraceae bacterium]|jgi:hypothetical protein
MRPHALRGKADYDHAARQCFHRMALSAGYNLSGNGNFTTHQATISATTTAGHDNSSRFPSTDAIASAEMVVVFLGLYGRWCNGRLLAMSLGVIFDRRARLPLTAA